MCHLYIYCLPVPNLPFFLLYPVMLELDSWIFLLANWHNVRCCQQIVYRRVLAPWKKSYDQPRQHIKKQRHYFANKGLYSQSFGFSGSHVWMWELDYKESWVLKNWCSRTVVLKKILESPLNCKETQPVHPKGNQSWIFIGRTDFSWSWNSNTLATWYEEQTHLKRPWWWERLKAGGEGYNGGWGGWMASSTQWTWVWISSRSWWWIGRPGMLQSMVSQRVGHDWSTELSWLSIGETERGLAEEGASFPDAVVRFLPSITWRPAVCRTSGSQSPLASQVSRRLSTSLSLSLPQETASCRSVLAYPCHQGVVSGRPVLAHQGLSGQLLMKQLQSTGTLGYFSSSLVCCSHTLSNWVRILAFVCWGCLSSKFLVLPLLTLSQS